MTAPAGWVRVSLAVDVGPEGECSVCRVEYGDCPCPGPMMDDYIYEIFDGELYARRAGEEQP